MIRAIGLDGFRNGWVAVEIAGHRRSVTVHANVAEFLRREFDRAAIDMPIGLPDQGYRSCDLAARALLRPHASRVFTGARRGLWSHASMEAANRALAARGEPGVSAQLWNIGPKIMELDAVMTPALQQRVVEAHPELTFWRLNGHRPLPRKHDPDGIALRRALLLRDGFTEIDGWLDVWRKGKGIKADDVLDACAVAIAARDALHVVPSSPVAGDARGLKMQIWY